MRVQLSYHDRNGDEKWHYLEFDEQEGMFYLVTERCSRMGEETAGRAPLHMCTSSSGYRAAVEWIKKSMLNEVS